MPSRAPPDVAPEQPDARAEHHVRPRPVREHVAEQAHVVQGRGEIRVPETHERRRRRTTRTRMRLGNSGGVPAPQRAAHPETHSLRFPHVQSEVQDVDALGTLFARFAKHIERPVGASVVHEQQTRAHLGVARESHEIRHSQPRRLVVARDDDFDVDLPRGTEVVPTHQRRWRVARGGPLAARRGHPRRE